ncbi:hypothetical protein B4N89_47365 [Embleya scabrispora]|uniref:Uncharacterized protein n=1 Tax=Embleya scabrispora TaxID=159449 RepID=A0A1T3NIM1_9ACTN|nr:hypothetical protein B4N89_47365 [Embleya scabrispora]
MAASVGLIALAVVADLATAVAVGSVVGAVAGVVAAVGAVWVLLAPPTTDPVPTVSVSASGGSNASGGDMRNPRAGYTGPSSSPAPAPGPGVSASGGSNASGGGMTDPTAQHGP